MEEPNESFAVLLAQLFDLMEKSDNINAMPLENVALLKDKFRNSSIEQVKAGILLMQKDIAIQLKPQEDLKRNAEKLRELKIIDAEERKESEKLADIMLKTAGLIPPAKQKHPVIVFFLLLLIAVIVGSFVYYRYLR